MTRPPRARVRQSFERAAASYDSAAAVQRAICDRLLDELPALTPARILDAGCGTGYALGLLRARFPAAQHLALDLAPAMLRASEGKADRIAGDLEHLPLADTSLDLYWSSLAAQWCDLPRVLNEAQRVLIPGGYLILATLGPQTFHELRLAFAAVDRYQHTLAFHSVVEVGEIATVSGLLTVNVKNWPKTAFYPDLKTLLRAVKAIGANQVGAGRRTSLMSRTAFAQAEAAYETLRTPAGLPLTYDVITLQAQR